MKISAVIKKLTTILQDKGDIECESDCPYCNRSFHVGTVAVAPETARLNHTSVDGPIGTREIK